MSWLGIFSPRMTVNVRDFSLLNQHLYEFKQHVVINKESDLHILLRQLDISDTSKAMIRGKADPGAWINIQESGWVLSSHVFILHIPCYKHHSLFGMYYNPYGIRFLPNQVQMYLSRFSYTMATFMPVVRALADRFGLTQIPSTLEECVLFCAILLRLVEIPDCCNKN